MLKKYTFKGGIHPLQERHGGKNETRGEKIRAYSDNVTIRCIHIGAPAYRVSKRRCRQTRQVIGEAANPRSIPVHASVSGMVTDVDAADGSEHASQRHHCKRQAGRMFTWLSWRCGNNPAKIIYQPFAMPAFALARCFPTHAT